MDKICIKCNFAGEDFLFVKKENICKKCKKEYNIIYRKKYKKDHSEYLKEYYKKNKEEILCKQKIYYEKNKDKILLRQKKYDESHNEVSEYRKQYKKDHKEEARQYYLNNKEKLLKYHNEYIKKRYTEDPVFKLRRNCSKLIYYVLKSKKSRRSILNYLPYTIQELKEHLENQFDENMSWDNYGSYWHIDHIIPQSLLSYLSMEDENFKKCWSLDNLRPLEKIENIKKGNKVLNNIVRNLQ